MKLYAAPLNFRDIAREFNVPTEFSAQQHEAAQRLTDSLAATRRDARDIEFVTIDPPGSMDLDQAVCIERSASGYTVHYAIADVAAFVEGTDNPVREESLKRGQTIYLPDEPARLHPPELSEGSASLLPDVDRPAVLWTFQLDSRGEVTDTFVERALVRSRARFDYDEVQEGMDRGVVHASISLLAEVGTLRQESSLRREAINLRLPSVRVVETDQGRFELVIEPRHPVMDYNSEISLLTGMAAGQMMVQAGKGFLRTLSPATNGAEKEFRQEMRNLGFQIGDEPIGEFLASVNADTPRGMAVMREAQKLLRGAGYINLEEKEPEVHAGIGGYYSHVTAPLRRLIDRYATEVCLAICAGTEPPAWVAEGANQVVKTMGRTSQLANTVDRACLNLTEATVLKPWVGQNFQAVVLKTEAERDASRIFVIDPPVLAPCLGQPEEGVETSVSLVRASIAEREVTFAWPAD
ncbi:RNB domain-containing ribonuclease [Corynebacterium sanguinis]|uniref:RNB domain-containing ribonuclease n=1 Tax=Corynebacterium sanguinis TaxID=2594913 RepID=UPI00119DB96F|nr:RNB domain-containing ribonuclease [Corynebacterium sanguinis]MCT1462795.1 RNB domain-containing ribonuclease [Corynebacterium sanguinis]MCT1804441.1 RNB domain-containing ribonuclease [Corynebacterium sanguinis]MCT2157738.1 RNB domain-containing ribonuclease [Corynebacterium sanguinis]MCT2329045.1 RNB domain-containing ribonuclease [Corynebacterium sanguinis]TVS24744.1 RNB domain-containing ribonuclease [Corynebacterium sanguinis]